MPVQPTPFKLLPQEKKDKIALSFVRGESIEVYSCHLDRWVSHWHLSNDPNTAYRIKPRKISLDWSALDPRWRYAAITRTENNLVILFENEPCVSGNYWCASAGDEHIISAHLLADFDKGNCYWADSLISREDTVSNQLLGRETL